MVNETTMEVQNQRAHMNSGAFKREKDGFLKNDVGTHYYPF